VTIRPANLRDACFIAANMRDQDRREIDAVLQFDSTAQIAAACLYASEDRAFIAYLNGDPVAAMGLTPLHPGCLSGWAWGTKRMWRVIPAVTRFCRASWRKLQAEGFRRIEVHTIADHDISHQWLEKIGAKREGIARAYGRNGEDYVTYALTTARD
jgi:RimJ/RimL family protein N-acetyltransferase